jgi:hypothetical protein
MMHWMPVVVLIQTKATAFLVSATTLYPLSTQKIGRNKKDSKITRVPVWADAFWGNS